MTGSEAVFDSWAWWEVMVGSRRGLRLRKRYLRNPGMRVHTSTLAVGEIVARFLSAGDADHAQRAGPLIQGASQVHPVKLSHATDGARIRQELRRVNPRASLADGIMSALAAELNASLISGDTAFSAAKGAKSV